MDYENVMTPFRQKLAGILAKLPAVPTNAQNGDAVKALLKLIDDMEVARIKATLEP